MNLTRTPKRSLIASTAALLFISALTACVDIPIGGWEVSQLTDAPFDADVSDSSITLTDGTAVLLRIVIYDDERYLIVPNNEVTFTVEGGVATVVPKNQGHYFLGGTASGQGVLVGTAESYSGEVRIPITITPQP